MCVSSDLHCFEAGRFVIDQSTGADGWLEGGSGHSFSMYTLPLPLHQRTEPTSKTCKKKNANAQSVAHISGSPGMCVGLYVHQHPTSVDTLGMLAREQGLPKKKEKKKKKENTTLQTYRNRSAANESRMRDNEQLRQPILKEVSERQ